MPKLDVGVGDEFPAKEVRADPEEEPVVHHHHYYRRGYYYRRPGRWLWFVAWILFLSFAFRALDFAFGPPHAPWHGDWGWDGWSHGYYGGWGALKRTLMAFLIIAGLIWIGRCRRQEDERDAERRDRDGR